MIDRAKVSAGQPFINDACHILQTGHKKTSPLKEEASAGKFNPKFTASQFYGR